MDLVRMNQTDIELRKQLKLPPRKPLRYVRRKSGCYEEFSVVKVEIVKKYLSDWYTLKITLESGETLNINSDYFKHMQKSSFVKDMEAAEKEI